MGTPDTGHFEVPTDGYGTRIARSDATGYGGILSYASQQNTTILELECSLTYKPSVDVRFGSLADIPMGVSDVRLLPKADIKRTTAMSAKGQQRTFSRRKI